MLFHTRFFVWGTSLLWLGCAAGCSSVRYLYTAPHYAEQTRGAVKRVVVSSWAGAQQQGLSEALTAVTADLLKLRKNYLVTATASEAHFGASLCTQGIEGVVMVRSLGDIPHPLPHRVALRLAVELYRCSDGMLIYRGEGKATSRSEDHALSELTRNYKNQLGEASAPFIAPAFIILQQLVEPLYDPQLTEADIEEKIELGHNTRLDTPKRV